MNMRFNLVSDNKYIQSIEDYDERKLAIKNNILGHTDEGISILAEALLMAMKERLGIEPSMNIVIGDVEGFLEKHNIDPGSSRSGTFGRHGFSVYRNSSKKTDK